MKRRFYSISKSIDKVYVYINDWCPICIEYKVILNKVISEQQIEIDFCMPKDIKIKAIPTTVFKKGRRYYIYTGFMSYTKFINTYNEILKI